MRWTAWLITALCWLLAGGALAQPIDFARDIQPIFQTHCVKCHGPDRAESGLSLHDRTQALIGGDSGKPVLGGTLKTNEVLRRVNSNDPHQRMPLEAPPLEAETIDRLTRWVEQGTPWPAAEPGPADTPQAGKSTVVQRLLDRWVRPYLPWWLGLLVAVAVIERVKVWGRKRRGDEGGAIAGWRGWVYAGARRVGVPVYLIAVLGIVVVALTDRVSWLETKLVRERAGFRAAFDQPTFESVFGDPPVPLRPSHPPRMGGTYYRGNSERNPALYNNGYYLTATLELSLVDQRGAVVDYGSPVEGGLRVRLEIKRAPGATPVLFSEKIMSGLALATGHVRDGGTLAGDGVATFAPTADPDAWHAFYEVPQGERSGLIYLYRGNRDDGGIQITGPPQLGIVYELNLADGRVAQGSELWLDAIYYPSEDVALPVRPKLIPWSEWYDHRPMPIIQGENTTDPELLGTDEYLAPDGED